MTPGVPAGTIQGATFYHRIAPCKLCKDPLGGAEVEWSDWQVNTGDSVWAAMIGPLNFLYLATNGTMPRYVSFASAHPTVQLAISILPALVALQSTPGSMYHCAAGSNMWPADADEATDISNENNLGAYAGLRMLEFNLANNTDGADAVLIKAKQDVDKLIEGLEKWFNGDGLFTAESFGGNQVPSGTPGHTGNTPTYREYCQTNPTSGACEAPGESNDGQPVKIIYQGGHVSFGGDYRPVKILDYSGFAVDCQVWGLSVLVPYFGLDWLEGKLGGTDGAYNLFQQIKLRSGYYVNGKLAGVGWTQDLDLNCVKAVKPKDNLTCTQHRVRSSEYSYGAMNAAKILADAYEKKDKGGLAAKLRADAASMREHVNAPRHLGGMSNDDGGILFSNRLFFAPWGWWTYDASHLGTTAWSIMEAEDFSPWVLGGDSGDYPGRTPRVRVEAMATGKSAGFHEPRA